MDKQTMEQLIKETSREEFENRIYEMPVEELDDVLFELRVRLSNIRSKIVTTQTNKHLAELQGNKNDLEQALKRLSALYSAEGWLKSKAMLANRALEKRTGKPEAERLLENTIIGAKPSE